MKLPVYNKEGKKTQKSIELDDAIFGVEPNEHVVWLDVKAIQANGRQGTHSSKGRSYVSGGGRKPFKQKGTGRARQGSSRAPHHVGGGRVFGPEPRNYFQKVNKKVKILARKVVLSNKLKNDKVFVIEDFNFEQPKTKNIIELLKTMGLDSEKILFLTSDYAPNIYKSIHNLYGVNVKENATFSTYDVLKADTLIIQKGALQKINEVLN